ncbi:hypothetical protein FQN57_002885 [Myotisia sp. PD_48]|nr:hypothetical protein FQN57_002885 [Myotisia sp. PD_48]
MSKVGFVVSTSVLFGLCWIAAIGRGIIRLRVQRRVSMDDACLVFGLLCLTTAIGILHRTTIEKVYINAAVSFRADVKLPPNVVPILFDYQKYVQAPPIRQQMPIARTSADRYHLRQDECATPKGQRRASLYLFTHMGLDLLGDILIRLISKVRVRWTQKLALAFSLCLTILMSIVTVIRGAGIYYRGMIDIGWELYWVIICAEIGLILAASTAFRSFFLARGQEKGSPPSDTSQSHAHHRIIERLRQFFIPRSDGSPPSEHLDNRLSPAVKMNSLSHSNHRITSRTVIESGGKKDSFHHGILVKHEIRSESEDFTDRAEFPLIKAPAAAHEKGHSNGKRNYWSPQKSKLFYN